MKAKDAQNLTKEAIQIYKEGRLDRIYAAIKEAAEKRNYSVYLPYYLGKCKETEQLKKDGFIIEPYDNYTCTMVSWEK